MTCWTITLEEADDGSGDLVMPLPPDLLESAGWKEGDVLDWTDNKNGTWSLTKKDEHSSTYYDTDRNK
jgi:hypothetical protein